jgi:hypothetical protein
MNGPTPTTSGKTRLAERQPPRGLAQSSTFLPTATAGLAAVAWGAVLLYQMISGFEWSRASALLGLLLPIGALAPFTALFRRKPATILPFMTTASPDPEPQPRRHRELNGAPLDSIPTVLPLWRLFDKVARTGRTDYPVVDESGCLVGIISRDDLPAYPAREVLGWLVAADIMRAPKSAA